MRKWIALIEWVAIEEAKSHIVQEWGRVQVCTHSIHHQMMMPPEGTYVEVLEPLQTCHPSSGSGLVNQCIPAGVYRVGFLEADTTSHWGRLYGNDGAKLFFALGYTLLDRNSGDPPHGPPRVIDWRGARRFEGTVAKLPQAIKNDRNHVNTLSFYLVFVIFLLFVSVGACFRLSWLPFGHTPPLAGFRSARP